MNEKKPSPTTAIAFNYDGKNAPHVSAKGVGPVADKILAVARQHNIPIYEDPDLVTLLGSLDLGNEIPESLYHAVAEIIAFAYILTGKVPEQFKRK